MFEEVIEAMVDAVVVIDLEGRITMANTAAARLSGYALAELANMPIAKLLVDDSSGFRTIVRRRVEKGAELRKEETWLVPRTGDRIPVSVTGAPVFVDGNMLRGIVLVARDIRELRQLLAEKEAEIARRTCAEDELRAAKASIEEQLEATRTQLLLAERRATLGTLASGVGHELRNIAQIQIVAVDQLAEAVEAGHDVSELARKILPDLERVGEHITAHGQRLMKLARPGPDHVELLDVAAIVDEVVAMLRGAGTLRRHEVITRRGNGPQRARVNRTRIEQVFVNLIVNAIDALGTTPGTITISVAPTPDDTRIACAVADTGSGIPPEQLEQIFQPFFTTKPPERGTGLGLSVAREIVESYGGALRVSSTPGQGTTFTFDLPR